MPATVSLCACHYNFEDCDFISYLQVAVMKKCIYLYINKLNIFVAIWQEVGGESHVKCIGMSGFLPSFFSFCLKAFCFPPETELV